MAIFGSAITVIATCDHLQLGDHGWCLNTKTGACRDMRQARPIFMGIMHNFQVFLWANHIYYHSDIESPIPDDVYDAIVRSLEENYDQLPKWFTDSVPKGKIKSMAHAITLEPEEQMESVAWAKGIMEIKNGE